MQPVRPQQRALLALLAVGPLISCVILGIAAPLQSYPERQMLGSWLGATTAPLGWTGIGIETHTGVTVSVIALVTVWLAVAVLLARRPTTGRLIPCATAAWAAPFALGAPFLSRDVYAYLGQGELMRRGYPPYDTAVSALPADGIVLQAVDPLWHNTIPPYGPLSLRVEHLAAILGNGHEWVGILLFRVVAVLSVLAIIVLVRREAAPGRRDLLTWVACSPLVLMHFIGAAHLDALMAALAVGAVVALRRDHLAWAAVLGVAAAEVKVTAGLVLIAMLVWLWQTQGRHVAIRFAAFATAAGVAGFLLLPSDPLGWMWHLSTPGLTWVPFTPSSTLLLIATHVAEIIGDSPSWLRGACRAVAAALGLALAVWAVRRSKTYGSAWTAAMLLLAACIGGPVLWPWYLATSALLLLLATRGWTPLALALGTIGSMMALPVGIVAAQRLSFAAELVAVAGVLLYAARRRREQPAMASASG